MAKALILVGHVRQDSYCQALAEAYARGARAAGHEVALCNLAPLTFDPILREGFDRAQPLEPDLKAPHDALLSADHLVIVFPLWLGGLPAILKGFLERILQPDLLEPARKGQFAKLLKGKSARIVVTMGMPAFVYRWYFRAHAVKMLKRNILGFLGAGPIGVTLHGGVEAVSAEKRRSWLADAERLGRRLK